MSALAVSRGVVAKINEQEFSHNFEAKRRAWPDNSAVKADAVSVAVYDGGRVAEQVTRGMWQSKYSVFVVVQRKIEATAADSMVESDRLVEFMEEIATYFEQDGDIGEDYTLERFDDSIDRLPFDAELLQDVGVFSSFFGLVYAG